MDKQNDIEFDLIELLLFIKKKLLIVLLVVALFASAGFAYTKFLSTPTYTADARLHVFREGDDSMDISSMQVVTALRKDVQELVTGRNISQKVIDRLGLNVNADYLSGQIQVTSEESTRILDLSFTDTDPVRAATILNEVCIVAKEEMKLLMGDNVVNIVYPAEVPLYPSSTSPTSNAILFGVIGLVLVLLVLIVVFLMDDTIRSEEDVERHLGLSTLSSIPVCQELSSLKQIGGKPSVRGKSQRRAR